MKDQLYDTKQQRYRDILLHFMAEITTLAQLPQKKAETSTDLAKIY
jgi:hypothetical protein